MPRQPAYQLAQLNIATMVADLDDPVMDDFRVNLDRVNRLGDASEGFVWRLKGDDSANAVDLRPLGEDCLVNVTVWRDVESLKDYIYSDDHLAMMRRKREWFKPATGPQVVLWWVPAGHKPGIEEACERLVLLQQQGPTREAFTFRKQFAPPFVLRTD